MLRKGGIALRLILVFTLSSSLIFTVIMAYNYRSSSLILQQELESDSRNLGLSLVHQVEKKIVAVSKIAEAMARGLEHTSYSETELLNFIRQTVADSPEIYGLSVSFEPYAFSADTQFFDPYYHRPEGELSYIAPNQSYDYRQKDWYRIAAESQSVAWSEPYMDDGGVNTLMATYSVPFYLGKDEGRKFSGIVAVDVTLDDLRKLISSVQILETGYAAIISQTGTIIAHPQADLILDENLLRLAETSGDADLAALVQRMIRGESDFVHYTNPMGDKSWLYFAPLGGSDWTLAVTFPDAEMYADLNRMSVTMLGMWLAGVLLLAVAVTLIAHSITRSLRTLAAASRQLATGNFDLELPPVRSDDEVGQLTRAFDCMNSSLRRYIHDLTETTAAKERIQSELRVATDIQLSLLPRIFPPFPERPEFSIHASIDPAKEVGGDFYDFFFIDDNKLCFLIADVADKGVPAALYMMVAKTLLKSEAQRVRSPAEILSRVNEILAKDNDNAMFVTVFCAILNIRSGEVRFANAGHNPPLFTGSGNYSYLQPKVGFVLGPIPGSVYETESLFMQPGDVLFLYTDGVTEAKNPAAQLFGEERLLATLEQNRATDLPSLLQRVRTEVALHAADAEQSDDVTMLALAYHGSTASP